MPGMQGAPDHTLTMRDQDFATIVRLVRERTGIALGERKRNLVYGRLARRLRAHGLDDFADYCRILQSPDGEEESRLMTNAITTNLTCFFREPHHFDYLADEVLGPMARSAPRRLRLWSAGCSTGEEPYSIAMTMRRTMPGLDRWDARILATDIDSDVLRHAGAGRYDTDRIGSIPQANAKQYLHHVDQSTVEIADSVRSLIVFKRLNLFDSWPMTGKFDVVFCRNVIIYFDRTSQRELFERFAQIIVPGGWLFIGHSEALHESGRRFEHVGRTIYRRLG